ncbi:inositol polyphosphate-5-phosphatase A-like isoform X3 [Acropora millepora]|uniref:inositol polyphosphate-5-phosphatase A-like isoform X3 n=1 Tax=Acropora millepora TaxID=45264 RepID=UPI0010FC8CC5|nr:inositol polyphosphate-5-phosphatase A-like isoform X3 [Acropora millepora]
MPRYSRKNFVCSQSLGRSRNGHRHPTAELARRVRQSAPVGNGKILTFTVYATQNVEDEADIVRELNMGDHTVPLLLITANVGSVFENRGGLEERWMREILSTIARFKAKFVAVHFQESGGKNSGEDSLQNVREFVRIFLGQAQLRERYDRVRAWFDQDYRRQEHYTALGCIYLVSRSLKDISLWDFEEATFKRLEDGEHISVGSLLDVPFLEKAKFPLDFFPKFKWSRKGFLRTRWKISKCIFDLLNIHLFHDASNLVSIEMTPSEYTNNRKRALDHVLDRLHHSSIPLVPHILFGDFNFRLDNKRVVETLCAGLPQQHIRKDGESSPSKIVFRDRKKADKVFLTLEPRIFKFHDESIFRYHNGKKFSKYNKEFDAFKDRLFEFDISFIPSYPFSENVKEMTTYGDSRCPSWCDRIFLSHSYRELIEEKKGSPVVYDMIGKQTCMGDHKPIFLFFNLSCFGDTLNQGQAGK